MKKLLLSLVLSALFGPLSSQAIPALDKTSKDPVETATFGLG